MADLHALPGGGSSATSWITDSGLIAGLSENGETDPTLPSLPEVRAVLWKNGAITDLGLFPEGGYQSFANAVNSRGQVVGAATNTVSDDFSLGGGTQTHAFLWQDGQMRDLGTLGGTDSEALLINERGQIVGESYVDNTQSAYCADLDLPISSGAFIWQDGKMTKLGSFGGTCTFASDINNQGQIVGLSSLPGDTVQHAFLWQDGVFSELHNSLGGDNAAALAINKDGDAVGWGALPAAPGISPANAPIYALLWKDDTMLDLGTVEDDPCSIAFTSNSSTQVVGISVPSCDFSQARAFLWQAGWMFDLNALIPANSPLYLSAPETINERGEIAGTGFDSDGNQHAFLLIPCDQSHPSFQGCDYSPVDASVLRRVHPSLEEKTMGSGVGSSNIPLGIGPFLRIANQRRRLGLR